MTKIKHAMINFYLKSAGIHEFKTADSYIISLYENGYGFRELAKKINAAQKIQITPQGLRKHLITRGLKPDPSRYKTRAFPPSQLDEARIKADYEQAEKYKKQIASMELGYNETIAQYIKQIQEKDEEISRLSFLLLNAITDLTGILNNKSWDELGVLIKELDKEFNAFS